MIRAKVRTVGVDLNSQKPVVILTDEKSKGMLPIMVGPNEAQAIAMGLKDIDTPRPLTHDLIINLISACDMDVEKIIITALKDDTYYADIVLKKYGVDAKVDSRPSDAIAIALRCGAPIYIAKDVVDQTGMFEMEFEESMAKEESNGEKNFEKYVDDVLDNLFSDDSNDR